MEFIFNYFLYLKGCIPYLKAYVFGNVLTLYNNIIRMMMFYSVHILPDHLLDFMTGLYVLLDGKRYRITSANIDGVNVTNKFIIYMNNDEVPTLSDMKRWIGEGNRLVVEYYCESEHHTLDIDLVNGVNKTTQDFLDMGCIVL